MDTLTTIKILLILIVSIGCQETNKKTFGLDEKLNEIICDDYGCIGSYSGQEFINGSDSFNKN